MKKDLNALRKELLEMQQANLKLSAHYTPVYDTEKNKWYILMHNPGVRSGNDCDDAKTEDVAYKKAISWMKKEIKGYLYELKHPNN